MLTACFNFSQRTFTIGYDTILLWQMHLNIMEIWKIIMKPYLIQKETLSGILCSIIFSHIFIFFPLLCGTKSHPSIALSLCLFFTWGELASTQNSNVYELRTLAWIMFKISSMPCIMNFNSFEFSIFVFFVKKIYMRLNAFGFQLISLYVT